MYQDKSSVSGDFKVLDIPNIYHETAITGFEDTWLAKGKSPDDFQTSEHDLLNGSEVIIEEDENQTSSGGLYTEPNADTGAMGNSPALKPKRAQTPNTVIPKLNLREKVKSFDVAEGSPIRKETVVPGETPGDYR